MDHLCEFLSFLYFHCFYSYEAFDSVFSVLAYVFGLSVKVVSPVHASMLITAV